MRRLWRVYRALFRVEVGLVMAYRAEIVIWMVTGVLPLIMLAAWLALGAGGPVGSFAPRDFIAYYLAAIFVRQMTGVWIVWDMDFQIRQGEFSTRLLRPIDPIHQWAMAALGSKWLRFLVLLPILAPVAVATGARYDLRPATLLLFAVTIFGAWLLGFFIQYCNGLLGFWLTQVTAIFELWFGLYSIFSGYLIPLELLPPAVGAVAHWLPFRYQLALPLEIVLGRVAGTELWQGLALQWLWIAGFFGLSRLLWRFGLRKYSAVGA